MDKEQIAIERIRAASEMSFARTGQPISIGYSGGKDSDVILEIAKRSGVPFEVHHNHTTVDAPQTVYHVRDVFRELELNGITCKINRPPMSMWQLIQHKKTPPTRVMRYCCDILKEQYGRGRHMVFGIRWEESAKRTGRGIHEKTHRDPKKRIMLCGDNDDKRRLTEFCTVKDIVGTNPIIDWKLGEVWDYINSENIEQNSLYERFPRVGCIGCPMSDKKRESEFLFFPKYKDAYIQTFGRTIEIRKSLGMTNRFNWQTAEDVFHWWMEDGYDPNQIEFDYELEELQT